MFVFLYDSWLVTLSKTDCIVLLGMCVKDQTIGRCYGVWHGFWIKSFLSYHLILHMISRLLDDVGCMMIMSECDQGL